MASGFIRLCLIAVLFGGVQISAGQAVPTSQPSADSQSAGMSQIVDEVTLDLAVQDKKHHKVLDLKPEDIQITDNDIPVKMNTFQLVQGDAQTDQLVTMVFDHFEGAGAKTAQTVADKILKMLSSKRYSFALLDFGNRMQLLQSFTADHKAMEQAVSTATANQVVRLSSTSTNAINITTDKADAERIKTAVQTEKNLVAIVRTGVDTAGRHVEPKERAQCQTLLAALQDTQKVMQDQHTRLALAGLLALVRSQQKLNERKSIIYFTSGFQLDSNSKDMVKTISGAAARAGVTFYTVDMDALDVGARHQIDNAMMNGGAPFDPVPKVIAVTPVGPVTAPSLQQQQSGSFNSNPLGSSADFMMRSDDGNPFSGAKSPMADLAKETGGVYIDAQEGVNKQLQQMRENMTTYYQATYKPPIEEYDGSFRSIVAKPLRAGYNVKTKSGYFALAPGAEAGIRPFEVPLLKLFNQSNLPQDVKFYAAVLQFGELPDGNSSTVAVQVPVASLQTIKDTRTNLFSAHVAIVAEIKDKNGTVIEHFGENIAKRGAVETLDSDPSASIILQRHFMAIPGQYLLEVAVYDQDGLKYGAQRTVFEIPQAQITPSLSPIVLVGHVDSINDDNEDPLEPLRYEKGKITPNLAGAVASNAKGVSLFFILHPDPKSSEPAILEMEASRNGHPGRRTPLPLKLKSAGEAVPYLATFKGSSMAPGNYEVKAMMSQGGKTSVQQVAFTVPGDGSVAAGAPGQGGGVAADLTASSEANDSYSGGLLAIIPVTNPVQPPADEEIASLIADAQTHSMGYAESLPNFMCVEVTNRSVDASGSGNWKHRDTLAELLRYRDKAETHTMLEINGVTSNTDREALLKQKGSTLSGGELGGVLKAVFAPSAKADFKWKETDALGSGTVQVFDYHVAKSNSMFSVVGSNDVQLMVGFHGQVYIDSATRNVRRISLEADDLPKDFPTQASVMGVDYDYVVINGRDYLMPISAEVRVRQNHHQAIMNTIEFRDYKKYGSAMKILDYKQVENSKQ
ncbi:VWA domain-containing protein [Telmatobacter sp. DSM 110680]|uniref:VWA domain-containing protein n=1 Tax=Telmatobacter sp. DSM 110680 TaxID=3036704 RepID=A0AAU7DRV9_9BACT